MYNWLQRHCVHYIHNHYFNNDETLGWKCILSVVTHPCVLLSTLWIAKSAIFVRSVRRAIRFTHSPCSSAVWWPTPLTQTAAEGFVAIPTPLIAQTAFFVRTTGRTAFGGKSTDSSTVRLLFGLPTDRTWKENIRRIRRCSLYAPLHACMHFSTGINVKVQQNNA